MAAMWPVRGPADPTANKSPEPRTGHGSTFMDGKRPLKIVIVGASCGGLFAGILLKRQGHNVHMLDLAPSSEREGFAAGIGLAAKVREFFDEHDRLKHIPFGSITPTLDFLDDDLNVTSSMPLGYRATSWDAAYYRLRANFDAYRSAYCENPPPLDPDEGEGLVEIGKRVLHVDDVEGTMTLTAEDVATQKQQRYEADIVIAADGANSTIRRQLLPNLQREEPGYMIWRGIVPTKDLSQALLDKIEHKMIIYRMKYSYVVIYTIPGAAGSLLPGERLINFAWYTWVTRSQIPSILTDTTGHVHRTTLPKGGMRPEIWAAQVAHARRVMSPHLHEIITKISHPFVSVVSSVAAPRAAYFDNRLFLIGDALAQLQPNSGQGTNMAAMDAMALADVVAGRLAPEDWEERVLGAAHAERMRALVIASGFLCGWWGIGASQVRWRWVLGWQRAWRWWCGRAYVPRVRAKL